MSLDSLFTDRNARKYIKESIDNAVDSGKGVCEYCGNDGFLLEAFGKHICENCCERLNEITDDYSTVFESRELSGDDIFDLLKEGYMVPDFEKLQKDANAKFGGSIKDLMKSYGLFIETYWNDKYLDGMLYISSKDIRSGSGKVNKFLIDYDSYFASKRGFSTVVPDADGTELPKQVAPQSRIDKNKQLAANDTINAPKKRGSSSTSQAVPQPASTPTVKAPKQKKPVVASTPKKTNSKLEIEGDENDFNIMIADGKVGIRCEKTSENGNSKTYNISVGGDSPATIVVDSEGKDFKFCAEKIIDGIIGNPGLVLHGFDGIHKDTFDINSYEVYQFVLDKQSFMGQFSVAIYYDGKVRPNNRVYLSSKAVVSRASLMGELTKYMEDSIKKKYPVLFDKHNVVTTSLGKAVFTFKGFDKDGDPVVEAELGNKPILGKFAKDDSAWTDLENAEENLRTLIDTAIRATGSVIPNYKNSPYYNPKSKPGVDEFDIVAKAGKPDEYTIHAEYRVNDFVETGNITFYMSVLDKRTGIEQPKEFAKVIYKKAGQPLDTFIKIEGDKIYKHYFSKSDMINTMTDSARNKMKNPSKKQGLFAKIAALFVKKHSEINALKDLEVESMIDVNADGKVTKASITVNDPYSEFAESSKALHDLIELDKKVEYLKFKKADTRMKDGPSVTYEVKDIEKFSNDLDLMILESLIMEAFDIVSVNESGRKVFHF